MSSNLGVLLCQFKDGKMSTKKVTLSNNSPVSKVFKEASGFCNVSEDSLILSYQGKPLNKAEKLDAYQVTDGGLIMATEIPKAPSSVTPAAVELSSDDVRKFIVSFKTAIKSPSFSKVVKRLLEKDNLENLVAACPGLSEDHVGQAFLTKTDLLAHLCDPETLKKVAKTHPCLLEAANNLAAAVHEEQQSVGRAGGQEAGAGAEGGSYYLDEMSDEDMDTDDDQQRAHRQRAGQGITPAQLAQALAMASGIGQGEGNMNPFQGVTGMGVSGQAGQQLPAAGQSGQSSTPSSANARITSNMFQAAMQQALLSAGMQTPPIGQTAPPSAQPSNQDQGDILAKVERMKEMGIIDEGLALQALQIMGGDLQAAVDLIFSGWEGGDDSMS